MSIVYLNNFNVFSYKKVLFFVGKIGVIKIKLPNNLADISFYINEFYINVVPSESNKTNVKLIEDICNKMNKTLLESAVGFSNKVMLFGIGFRSWSYRVESGFRYLVLKVGFSRDVSLKIPPIIKIIVLKPTLILFKSLDKNILNQFVSFLRLLKVPDHYKGKGLRYLDEKIVLKPGKT